MYGSRGGEYTISFARGVDDTGFVSTRLCEWNIKSSEILWLLIVRFRTWNKCQYILIFCRPVVHTASKYKHTHRNRIHREWWLSDVIGLASLSGKLRKNGWEGARAREIIPQIDWSRLRQLRPREKPRGQEGKSQCNASLKFKITGT